MKSRKLHYKTDSKLAGSGQEFRIIQFAQSELTRYLSYIPTEKGIAELEETEEIWVLFELPEAPLRYDGYEIFLTGDGRIHLRANTARGILHACYELLRQADFDFTFPGEQRQEIPQKADISTLSGRLSVRREPWLEYRGICLYHTTRQTLKETLETVDWMAKNGYNFLMTSIHRDDDTMQGDHAILWDEIGDVLLPELQKRGIVIDMSEHSTDWFFPRKELFGKYPEWFSLKDGRRQPYQICYSSQEAVEAYGDSLARFAADKPWIQFLGIWPLDGGDYCECQACQDRLAIYRAGVRIAGKIKKVRPDLAVEYLAYTPQSFSRPPRQIPDNMSVLVCSVRGRTAYEWACRAKDSQGAFYFDYGTGDHYRMRSNLKLDPDYSRETVNAMASYGFRGMLSLWLPVTCWWQACINYWYLKEFYYNPCADVSELTRRLAENLFGEHRGESMAGLLMEVYHKLQDGNLWNGSYQGHEWYWEHILNRNEALDKLHLQIYEDTWNSIMGRMKEEQPENPYHRRQLGLLKEYLTLQRLYYRQVDSYRAETGTQDQAEAYFEELKRCSEDTDNPFISESYARWRITGRDNILIPGQECAYEAADGGEDL